jgi:hypothetical protein
MKRALGCVNLTHYNFALHFKNSLPPFLPGGLSELIARSATVTGRVFLRKGTARPGNAGRQFDWRRRAQAMLTRRPANGFTVAALMLAVDDPTAKQVLSETAPATSRSALSERRLDQEAPLEIPDGVGVR